MNKYKYGWAWNKNIQAKQQNENFIKAIKLMTETLTDKKPLLTFNTDWNKRNNEDHDCHASPEDGCAGCPIQL